MSYIGHMGYMGCESRLEPVEAGIHRCLPHVTMQLIQLM